MLIRTAGLLALVSVGVLAGWGAGCAALGPGADKTVAAASAGEVTGKVFYLQRIALPPTTTLTVVLLDVTDSSKPKTLATDSRTIGGTTPADFKLKFSPSSIRSDRVYQVRATLDAAGQVWTHEQQYPVLTGGAPVYVEIRLSPSR